MAIKIKETPKPAINKKKHSNSPSVVSSTQKKKKDSAVVNKGKKNGTTAKAVNSGKPTVSEKVKLSDISVSSVCELKPTQVENAVKASFEAFNVTQQKSSGGKLFDSDPEPINLLVSAIKIPNGDPHPLYVQLPEPYLNNDSDICLIVKDLEKGWKVDHEPTIHHYRELLQSKKVSCISEIMPLRQLRVEYKPYEARSKLSKRFDAVLVDRKVAKFVPRYLGKSFYQAGKLPIPLDLEAKDLSAEFNKALATSTMSMSNHGTSTQIQVGLSNQTESAIAKNILAVHKSIEQSFPGKFANIRSLSLRFGNSEWNVPVYLSYATRDSVKLPANRKRSEPLIDDLSTLAPGWNVAVYPSGVVKKVKVQEYKKTKLDLAIEDPELDIPEEEITNTEKKDTGSSVKKPLKALKTSPSVPKKTKTTDIEEEPQPEKKKASKLKKKKSADDSSEDEGDALEEEYMKELDLLEEDLVDEPNEEADPEPQETKAKSKVKIANKTALKKKGKK